MADALCWLLASRAQILDILELERNGAENPAIAEAVPEYAHFFTDLAHVQAARAAGEVTRICTDLVFGFNRHPSWGDESVYKAEDVELLEGVMPGIHSCAGALTDVIEDDGSHAAKAGPCVRIRDVEPFVRLRDKLGGCGTGAGLAKDRAARALTGVMIPEALDYPI
jgi:hypothetical protein